MARSAKQTSLQVDAVLRCNVVQLHSAQRWALCPSLAPSDFGAWHLASDCVCGVSRRGVQVNVPALVVLFRRNGGM